MRITREMLLKSARDTVTIRIKIEKDLVAAYLVGSVLSEDPLLGGVTDIDLVLVHANPPAVPREIARVYDEVHLDILHHAQSVYLQPRELRIDPWLGYAIQDHPQLLYDVRHWFEFTQASVGSQFYRPDHANGRARNLSEQARTIWADLHQSKKTHADRIRLYLKALEYAGNSVACLSGAPLSRRRYSLLLPSRFEAINHADLKDGFNALTGINELTLVEIEALLPGWENAFLMAGKQEKCPLDLHPLRKDYYLRAIQTLLEESGGEAIAIPFLRIWNKAICSALSTTPEYDAWLQAMNRFHLGKDDFSDRLNGLDHFLDRLDEALDDWAFNNGA
jgi:hypothetical protein